MPKMEDADRTGPGNPVMEEELSSSFELTRSSSGAASSLSVEYYGGILHSGASGRPDNHSAWTDAMHNNFLDSLEASFVQQLHRSRGSLASWKEHKRGDKYVPRRLPASVNKASEQFAHLRDDGWQKVTFEKDQRLSYPIEIPWMHCQGLAEGSGQNFVDESSGNGSNVFALAKKVKAAGKDA